MGIFAVCECSRMWEKVVGCVCGKIKDGPEVEAKEKKKVKGTVVLKKKNVMDVTDVGASVVDRIYELLGNGVSLQLISSHLADSGQSLTTQTKIPHFFFLKIRKRRKWWCSLILEQCIYIYIIFKKWTKKEIVIKWLILVC